MLVVVVVKLDRSADQLVAGLFDLHRQTDPFPGIETKQEVIRMGVSGAGLGEEQSGRPFELHQHVGGGHRHPLAGHDEERHAGPAF